MRALAILFVCAAITTPVAAQTPDPLPPGHPQIAPDAPPPDELPPGHPQVAPDAPSDPSSPPRGGDISRAMQPPQVAAGTESDEVPAGAIRVTVVDVAGRPQAGAEVQLGIMRQGGDRERTPGTTGADGVYTYENLPTGVGQAYRVNVVYEGATYSSTPFQLPPTRGYDVRITRLPTTHDQRVLLLVIGQTYVEIHEERLHVVEEMQLSNLGDATYVFPEEGLRMELPEGWLAFQTQAVMTDQHVEEVAGFGVAIHGSLPPGRVTLAYAFDLPITGSEMTFELGLPMRSYIYRVVADAPASLSMDVDGMPRAIRFEDQGRSLLGTEVQREPGDAQMPLVRITLRGIPGPGPVRWIALAIAAVLVLGGALFAARGGGPRVSPREALAQRKRELLAELRELEAEFEAGEIGPSYRQSQRAALVRSLAAVLHEEDRLSGVNTPKPEPRTARG